MTKTPMRVALAFALPSLATASAHAQQELEEGVVLEVLAPLGDDGGRIDCTNDNFDNCEPLNLGRCEAGAEDRPFEVLLDSPNVPLNSRLLVFLTSDSDCEFDQVSELDDGPLETTLLNDQSDPLVSGQPFNFPDDAEDQGGGYGDVASILASSGACDEAVNDQTFLLCFVVSENNDEAEEGVPFGAVQILIDTTPPTPPTTFNVSPGDGRVDFTIDTDDQDIDEWNFRFRPAEGDGARCDAWPSSTTRTFDAIFQGEQSFNTDVDNGVTYETCAFANDDAGNTGDVSDTVTVTPRDECDFLECLPGEVNDSCAAGPGIPLCAALALLALFRRRKEHAA